MVTDACGRIDKIMPFIPSPWPVIRPGDRTLQSAHQRAPKVAQGAASRALVLSLPGAGVKMLLRPGCMAGPIMRVPYELAKAFTSSTFFAATTRNSPSMRPGVKMTMKRTREPVRLHQAWGMRLPK